MKKLILLVPVLGCVYYFSISARGEDNDERKASLTPIAAAPLATVPDHPASTRPDTSLQDCDIANVRKLVPPNGEFNRSVDQAVNSAIHSLKKSPELDRTTLPAKLGQFTLAMRCSPAGANADFSYLSVDTLLEITPATCAALAWSKAKSPLELISEDELQHSPEGMLIVASNALVEAKYLEYRGADEKQIQFHRALSEHLGRRAAVQGLEPAMLFMAEHYDAGSFGEVQLGRAYTYLKTMSEISSGEIGGEGAEYVYKKMTKDEFDRQEAGRKSCRATPSQDISLTSPFGKV